jgi:hemerythrin-like domain-containing protein
MIRLEDSSYEQPMALLQACHERVARSLALLQRLVAHLQARSGQPADAMDRSAAEDVRRYFEIAAPLHHQDEELHLFPLTRASGDPDLQGLCQTLAAQHVQMSAQWQDLSVQLQTLDTSSAALARLQHAVQAFSALYAQHLTLEDGQFYPALAPRLDADLQRHMGLEMGARRGLRFEP